MESLSVLQFLKDKTILVTGATGFLAKIFVEKILRIQPNVKKLYLVIRAGDNKSAKQRMFREVIETDLFRVLRDTWGDNLDSFVLEKLVAVHGDVLYEDLGISDSNLKEEMYRQIDLVVHTAAITKFDERYDVLLNTNTMGAFHILSFAKNCAKVHMLVHLSTAYACGEKSGLIPENSLTMSEMLSRPRKLDIIAEKKLVEQKLIQLQATCATEEEITSIMKDFGLKRARFYGWPNTYVFTKAMGETLLDHYKDNLPIVTIRPTMITSTFKEPFSGWIEGLRTIDFPIIGYGKGKLDCLYGNPQTIFDLIPADMVVNSMIMAMGENANNPASQIIYHVGSSLRNPIQLFKIHEFAFRYFTKNPFIDRHGNPVIVDKIKILDSSAKFHICMAIRGVLPLKLLKLVNLVFCRRYDDIANHYNQRMKFVMKLVYLYKPYMFFKGVFCDTNSEKLRMAMKESGMELDSFNFDPKSIDWEDYFLNTHIPGVLRYVVKS